MRKIVLLSIAVIFSFTAFSQDFSNKGKEFWFCFPSHVPSGAVLGRLQVWITSDQASSGTVSVTNGSFTSNFSVAANSITSVEIPYSAAHISNAESGTILQKSIKLQVTTGQPPVVAYLQQFGQARSAATLLLPTNVLGKKYYATSFFQNGTGRSQLQIIATKPNTNVVLTPKNNGVAQAPINISLPLVGDMYQYQSTQDITGSFVESVAGGSGGCSPVAVFSGSSGTSFGIQGCNTGTSVDPLLQQAYPISSWGKNFGFMPLGDYPNGNPYRIIAAEDNTILQINGTVVATLNAGEIYPNAYTANPVVLNTVSGISADKPISVSLYAQRNPCSGSGHGDPDMVILNPIEQNIRNISIFTSTQENINRQWINVLIPTVSAGSFRIDGAAPTTAFVPAANIPGYSTLTHQFNPATNLPRLLTADTGFNAICYGFEANQFESYAYSAGTNVRDLNQQLEVNNPNADPSETSSACTNSPFKFKVYFPAQDNQTPPVPILYDSMKWEVLPNGTGFIPNNFPVMVYGTVGTPPKVAIDSINIRNGKQVAWYSLSTTYTVTTPGTYTIRITVYRTSSEGCGNEQEYEFPLNVSDPPTASFTAPTPGCYLEPVVATETTPQVPKATYKWYWEFIDPAIPSTTIYTTRNATHTFTTPGVKTIRHASITTPGCLSDTIVQTVTLPQVPNGSIAGTTSVCTGAANPDITVTMVDGRAPYRFIYTINGVPQPPIVSPTGTYNISVPTGTPGTYVYELTEVRNDGSTVCVRSITGQTATVIVRPLPNAAIAGATTVCLNSAPAPVVTFTGSNATAPYTFNYTINGVAQTPIVSNAAGVATINAPTNVVGPFIYEITQVTDASSNTCTRAITATTTTIIVQDLPNAVIGSSSNAVCQNSAQPTVTFTGSVGTAPYTFNYTINGVAQTPVVSNAAGVATLNVPTGTVGTFIYEITQVQEASTQTCLRVITGQTVTVTVNPLPNAAIAGAVTVCLNATQPVVTFTGSNATAPYTFAYTINGVPQTPVVSNAAGVATVNAPTNAVGTFVYAITQITDASSTTCSRNISGTSTTIVVQDLPNAVIASSTTAVCLNSIPLPTITFTGNTGTAPYTFTYTINGVTQPTVVSNAAGVATITVPTNVATTYTYELTNVSEASGQTCARVITGQTRVVVVNPLPTATVTGAIAVCKDAPQPTVTFTGANATAPYTFNYTINGVAQPPLVSNAAGVATVLAPTNATGTFTYQLTSVRDASSTLCSQAQSGSTVITVNMLPAASYTYTIPSCANNTITFTNTTNPNAGGVTTWAWNFGDPGSGGANTSNLFSPTHTFALPGNYTVTLNAVNSNGCVSNPDAIQNIIINDTPRAGFIVPEVCINDVATVFTDTSSINAPSTVNRPLNEWNYGDPPSGPLNNSVGVNGVHLYPAPGVYTVRQIVTSNTGCRDTIYQDITINSADPVSNYDFINRTTLCSNDSVQLRNLSTVGFGNVTRLEIYWDVTGAPGVFETINVPVFNAIYKHKYLTNLQTTTTYNIRVVAYSGNVCFASRNDAITVHANPVVQFNNMPPTCLLVPPFQITQGSEVGGVPGTQSYSGPGIINAATGLFDPQVAGVGTHAIKYTFTASNPGACFDTLTKFITVIDTAHATFSYVSPTCENTPVSFTDLSTAPTGVVLANTVWNFGHGGPTGTGTYPPGATFTHVFPGVGNYTVTMHNLSAAGCLSTDTSAVITILPNHTIAGGGNSTQTVCINRPIADIVYTLGGGATNATVTGLPAGLNYTVAGGILTIFGSPTTTVGSPFNFTINTTGNACAIATSIGRITVQPDHTIVLATGNTNQSVCVNTAIEDIVYTIGGGATGIQLPNNLPPGVTATLSGNTVTISGTPTSTVGSPFNFSITTSGNGCLTDSRTGTIKVNPYPVPFFTPDKSVYCIPVATVKFNNGSTMPDGTGMTYAWEFDDPASGTLNNSTAISPTHFFATQRTYDVKLTATSLAVLNNGVIGCSKDIVIPLTTIKAQPKAAFSTNKPAVCIADDVIFTDESDPMGGTTITRYWDFTGSGTFISTPNPTTTHLYPTIGNYAPTLYIVNSFGCHSDTLPQPFTVYPYPDFNAGNDRTVLEFGTVTLDPQVTSTGNLDYLWTPNIYFNNNNKIKRPTASLIKDDITYKLTITNEGGCSRSDDVFIKVLKFPKIPNTFTPNNDGINDKWVIEYLNSYPNCRVQVFNRTGQLVFESKGYGTPWDGTMKGKSLPFDTYYYIIEPQAGRDPVTGYVTIVK